MPDDSDRSTIRVVTARNQEGPIAWAEVDEEWYHQTKRAEAVREQINEEYGDGVRAGIEEGDEIIGDNKAFAVRIEITGSVDADSFPDEIDGVPIQLYERDEKSGRSL